MTKFRGTRNYEPKQDPVDLHHSSNYWWLDWFSEGQKQDFAHHVGSFCRGLEPLRGRYHLQKLCGRHLVGITAGGICHASGEDPKIYARRCDAGDHNWRSGAKALPVVSIFRG